VPADFKVNPKIKRFLDGRAQAHKEGGPVDWGFGEALAFGTLLLEGTPVRLSGQDCERGTFSHRHAVLTTSRPASATRRSTNLDEKQARFCVYNSLLSEAAVLGFDYGYSLDYPEMLCLWEAQFGDFANGAQVVIDQFIASGESKWQRTSGIVLLLPHGYEGQGPEHSSARLERFLQLCAEDNIQVANLTTPANSSTPAPPDEARLPQAAGRHVAQVAAAPPGRRLPPRRVHRGRISRRSSTIPRLSREK
jgi:2-oxoglutarate dehydrogenase E1 component